jgi:DNA-binding transcriptional MerR regulator
MSDDDKNELPDKIYFKIGEVAEIVGVEPYVLRYWETEFPALRPGKSRSQQRLYRKRDVEVLLRIKKLLYDDMYTIAGAKRQLARSGDKGPSPQMDLQLPERPGAASGAAPVEAEVLRRLERELQELLTLAEAEDA